MVYDSPCKTVPELRFALEAGVHVNIDNCQELSRMAQLIGRGDDGGAALPRRGVVGLRCARAMHGHGAPPDARPHEATRLVS